MDSLSPEELVRRCRHAAPGDLQAFELLVRLYKERVFATAYRLMGNRQDAEDIAQEVFLKIHRGIRDLDEPVTLTAWIYRITSNTCLDALTKQQRRPRTRPLAAPDQDDAAPRYADPRTLTPEEAALRRELYECLHAALTQLDPAGRAAVILRDVEGRSYQEVAAVLAVGLSAVKMRIHRARLALQGLLERLCPDVVGARSGPTRRTPAPPG
jgi:RNA polymerase sigma-70 factor (ECF subfamily)